MKLTFKQRECLEHLDKGGWEVKWWGGRPHCGWPEFMSVQVYSSLTQKKLIETRCGKLFDKTVSITEAGRKVLGC